MNENDARAYASRLLRRLDAGLSGLDEGVAEALAAGRRKALARRHGAHAGRRPPRAAAYGFRYGLAAATLLTVMALTLWWPFQRPGVQEIGQLDIHLLTGELPPAAYIDEDFPAWRRLPGLCRS